VSLDEWWRRGVVYQIYPRSFADADGDGVGDLAGIRAHVDHLAWLGVDATWLSPVYRSPMADFGYDISDHCDIDPVFGDLATFDGLLADLHGAGLKLLLDWVPNHTSDRHPWFVESRSSRESPLRDWYVWRDRPNNWLAAFGGSAWTWDEVTTQWYLHLFLPQQPDLNWGEPAVESAMHDVLRFWLDRGVDGFRADVVHLIGKDPALPDQPPELAMTDLVGVHDDPRTHAFLRRIRAVLDAYPGGRPMVGEVNLGRPDLLAPYYGDASDELHLVFDFSLLWAPWDAEEWGRRVEASERALASRGAWPAWVLSNHDTPRHRTRYGGSEARARVAALVLLTLRGTPFLFAGEELGAQDAVVPPERVVDPGGRDGCRAPLPWTAGAGHGWPGEPWLPFEAGAEVANVEALRADRSSILWLYRDLLAARRASAALHAGAWERQDAPAQVLDYVRRAGDDERRVIANFGADDVALDLDGWTVELATGPSPAGALAGETAVLLRPES
jgi:alpha-glucosidase